MKKRIIVFLTLLFLLGCVNDSKTDQFKQNLPQLGSQISDKMSEYYTKLLDYDDKYSPEMIFSEESDFGVLINNMSETTEDIRVSNNELKDVILKYGTLKEVADINLLDKEDIQKVTEIDTKISSIDLDETTQCVKNIEIFNQFLELGSKNSENMDKFISLHTELSTTLDESDYERAKEIIAEFDPLIAKLKDNVNAQNELDIMSFNKDFLDSWGLFTKALDELKTYISFKEQDRETEAKAQFMIYVSTYSDALSANMAGGNTQSFEEMSDWYSKHIRTCLNQTEG